MSGGPWIVCFDGAATPAKKAEARLYDSRYCAPCGLLFWDAKDARQHRAEDHPEQARFEREES